MTKRNLMITTSLLYANGDVHLGHLVENIQADAWKRYHQMVGNECLLIGGSDAHGTPIMLKAESLNITPEEMVKKIRENQIADLQGFHINFDNYYTTHSDENKELTEEFYKKIEERGDIITKDLDQAYDPVKNMFLPDRFVKGDCPCCKTPGQYGDNCEACGSTYTPTALGNPVSVVSGATPIQKSSTHYLFDLNNHFDDLKKWISDGHLQPEVENKLAEWFKEGLQSWDISRDEPYFGFKIPGTDDKYFYVWLDAPIGYFASLDNLINESRRKLDNSSINLTDSNQSQSESYREKTLSTQNTTNLEITSDTSSKSSNNGIHNTKDITRYASLNIQDYMKPDSDIELCHFIGKDVMYFHSLFWPAILLSAGMRMPSKVFVNGFLTINGAKLSKSRGTFINARTYLNHLNPEYLRYYILAKLNGKIEDIDLNLEDFATRVNSDLVGKYVNIASRCAGFIHKKFGETLSTQMDNEELHQEFINQADAIKNHFEEREFSKAMRIIMELADKANQYIAHMQPWVLAKDPEQMDLAHKVCTTALNLFKILTIYLKPALPVTAEKVEKFLNIEPLEWSGISSPLLDHKINKFKPLITRIETDQITAMQDETKADIEKSNKETAS